MKKDILSSIFKAYIFSVVLIFLFYNILPLALLISFPVSGIFTWFSLKKINEERKHRLDLEFKDALYSISGALSSGYSLENSFREAIKDLKLIYGDKSLLIPEFQGIIKKNELNIPIEEAFAEFSEKAGVEDIEDFSEIINTAKRAGGNIIKISGETADKIGGKIEVTREIDTMLSGKKMEGRLMSVIPVFMIIYLRIFSPGFLDVMYTGTENRVIMTVMLVIYAAAFLLLNKITDIQV